MLLDFLLDAILKNMHRLLTHHYSLIAPRSPKFIALKGIFNKDLKKKKVFSHSKSFEDRANRL